MFQPSKIRVYVIDRTEKMDLIWFLKKRNKEVGKDEMYVRNILLGWWQTPFYEYQTSKLWKWRIYKSLECISKRKGNILFKGNIKKMLLIYFSLLTLTKQTKILDGRFHFNTSFLMSN